MEFPTLHPKLPGFVNLLALLQHCSAGAGTMIAMVMEPLNSYTGHRGIDRRMAWLSP